MKLNLGKRTSLAIVIAAITSAGAFATIHDESHAAAKTTEISAPPSIAEEAPPASTLPPGHPSIQSPSTNAIATSDDDEPQAITWLAPKTWARVESTSKMRLATYRPKRDRADSDDAELSIVRAGGTVDANIQRWRAQLASSDAKDATQIRSVVHGLHVTIVELHGTFLGGSMTGAAPTPHEGWTLLAAIVETEGTPYFFKMTGPRATVATSHAQFDAMIASIAPFSAASATTTIPRKN